MSIRIVVVTPSSAASFRFTRCWNLQRRCNSDHRPTSGHQSSRVQLRCSQAHLCLCRRSSPRSMPSPGPVRKIGEEISCAINKPVVCCVGVTFILSSYAGESGTKPVYLPSSPPVCVQKEKSEPRRPLPQPQVNTVAPYGQIRTCVDGWMESARSWRVLRGHEPLEAAFASQAHVRFSCLCGYRRPSSSPYSQCGCSLTGRRLSPLRKHLAGVSIVSSKATKMGHES